MKLKLSLIPVIGLTWFLLLPSISSAQVVNDAVNVLWKGKWYPAKVLKTNTDNKTFFIHYDGYGAEWDEWVGTDRITPLFVVGSACQVLWNGSWYPAKVKEVQNGKFKIGYDGYGVEWDEWVGTDRMKAK